MSAATTSFDHLLALLQAYAVHKGDLKMMILHDRQYFDMFSQFNPLDMASELMIDGLVFNVGTIHSSFLSDGECCEYMMVNCRAVVEYMKKYHEKFTKVVSFFANYNARSVQSYNQCINALAFCGKLGGKDIKDAIEYKSFLAACDAFGGDLVEILYIKHVKELQKSIMKLLPVYLSVELSSEDVDERFQSAWHVIIQSSFSYDNLSIGDMVVKFGSAQSLTDKHRLFTSWIRYVDWRMPALYLAPLISGLMSCDLPLPLVDFLKTLDCCKDMQNLMCTNGTKREQGDINNGPNVKPFNFMTLPMDVQARIFNFIASSTLLSIGNVFGVCQLWNTYYPIEDVICFNPPWLHMFVKDQCLKRSRFQRSIPPAKLRDMVDFFGNSDMQHIITSDISTLEYLFDRLGDLELSSKTIALLYSKFLNSKQRPILFFIPIHYKATTVAHVIQKLVETKFDFERLTASSESINSWSPSILAQSDIPQTDMLFIIKQLWLMQINHRDLDRYECIFEYLYFGKRTTGLLQFLFPDHPLDLNSLLKIATDALIRHPDLSRSSCTFPHQASLIINSDTMVEQVDIRVSPAYILAMAIADDCDDNIFQAVFKYLRDRHHFNVSTIDVISELHNLQS